MSDDHLTSEEECPDCSGFDRCDFHEGVRRGRQQVRDRDDIVQQGDVVRINGVEYVASNISKPIATYGDSVKVIELE